MFVSYGCCDLVLSKSWSYCCGAVCFDLVLPEPMSCSGAVLSSDCVIKAYLLV